MRKYCVRNKCMAGNSQTNFLLRGLPPVPVLERNPRDRHGTAKLRFATRVSLLKYTVYTHVICVQFEVIVAYFSA